MEVRERKPLSDRSNDSPNEQPIDQVGDKRQRLQSSFIIVVGIVRLLNVLCPITSFVPDEYWQALEVAHRLAFGYPLHRFFFPAHNYHGTFWVYRDV